jgi:hypothetical protein
LKNGCATQIASYRACLDKHAAQDDALVEARCGVLMREVWECSERIMAEIEGRRMGGGVRREGERMV